MTTLINLLPKSVLAYIGMVVFKYEKAKVWVQIKWQAFKEFFEIKNAKEAWEMTIGLGIILLWCYGAIRSIRTYRERAVVVQAALAKYEASKKGALMPYQVLSYETVIEGDVIKQVIIKNYGDRNRLREIVSSLRWTLDKMNEKVRTSGSST